MKIEEINKRDAFSESKEGRYIAAIEVTICFMLYILIVLYTMLTDQYIKKVLSAPHSPLIFSLVFMIIAIGIFLGAYSMKCKSLIVWRFIK